MSISAITTASQLPINFFPNHFTIQKLHCKRTIGKSKKLQDLYVLDTNNKEIELLNTQSIIHANNMSVQV